MRSGAFEAEIEGMRFDDGLLDLCVGLGLLGEGICFLTGWHAVAGVLPALLIPLWMILRQRITGSRLSRLPSPSAPRPIQRAQLTSAVALGIGALLLVGAAALGLRRGPAAPEAWAALGPQIPGALVGFGLMVASLMIGARRFVVYGLALALLAAVTTRLGAEPEAYLLVGGALLTAWAGLLVARFVAAHPRVASPPGRRD